jgi:hypothetical protein
MKVGKHNVLSGDTAPVRTDSSIDVEYSYPTLRFAVWPRERKGGRKREGERKGGKEREKEREEFIDNQQVTESR